MINKEHNSMPLGQFGYAWFFEDIAKEIIDEIIFIASDEADILVKRARVFRDDSSTDYNHMLFDCVSQVRVKDTQIDRYAVKAEEWLRSLPISLEERVYVTYSYDCAFTLAWSTFLEIWDSAWLPFYYLNLFDESYEWAVLMGPHETAWFIEVQND